MVVNLSVDTSSVDLMELAKDLDAFYIDTVVEPWPGLYTDKSLSISQRSNYALREGVLELRRRRPGGVTAVSCCGANPGMVSWMVKQALVDIAKELKLDFVEPQSRDDWARLMQRAGVKGIHIAERDTQRARTPKPRGEFVNTWSVEGFVAEGLQPSELGWGTHEKTMPAGSARHDFGCDAAIYLKRPGAGTRVRSWTPTAQAQHGFLVTHNELISIADYFTLREGGKVVYRPTCHYAYHPCDDAVLSLHEMAGAQWKPQQSWTILSEDDIVDGVDELGVLLYGHAKNAYWYGSQLSIEETRRLAPYQNATGLQVTSAVLAGIVWMIENPDRGIVEADEWTSAAAWTCSGLISDRSPVTTPTGPRWPVGASCSRRTWTGATPGSSRTCSFSDATPARNSDYRPPERGGRRVAPGGGRLREWLDPAPGPFPLSGGGSATGWPWKSLAMTPDTSALLARMGSTTVTRLPQLTIG